MPRTHDRRKLLSGIGLTAAAFAFRPASTGAQERTHFAPAHHAEDEWLDAIPGKHRVFIDSVSADGASEALLFGSNLYTANKSGYGLEDGDLAIVVCFRHLSTSFGFNNDMWAKYGKTLADLAKYTGGRGGGGDAPATNPHLRAITGLSRHGSHFAVCDMATHRLADSAARATGGVSADVYRELVANAAPNSHFVAAGVVAATRAQEYGYSLLVAG